VGEVNNDSKKSAAKRRWKYHLMLLADNDNGEIKQIGIDQILVEILAAIILIALIVTVTGWVVSSNNYQKAAQTNIDLTAKNEELTGQVSDLTATNSELTNKVEILGETVKTKVEQESNIQKESDEAHLPEGFPISASASMTTDENNANIVLFTCSAGANIIATGAGTVIEISPDSDYGHVIKIDHGNGYTTEYYGSSEPLVRKGDDVIPGSILAIIGDKNSKVAYRVYKEGQPIDPMSIIKIDG